MADGTRERGAISLVDTDVPEFRDRDTRLRLLDGWGIDAAVMLPTAGWRGTRRWRTTPRPRRRAACPFNRWLEDDWGYAYRDRLFAPPFISLHDVDESVRELERVLARCTHGAHPHRTGGGAFAGRRLTSTRSGRWIHEARIPVVLHVSRPRLMGSTSPLDWGEDPASAPPQGHVRLPVRLLLF